jgi:hypothetical protein
MSPTWERILELAARGELLVSRHGLRELAADAILLDEVVDGIWAADVVEDYPQFPKGPCVLVLESGSDGRPIHVLWGIPKGRQSPAVLITAYRPQPEKWSGDFKRRRR